jgi:hypothetical protein
MKIYTVSQVANSKRATKAEYNFAVIGKRNIEHAIKCLENEKINTTYLLRIEQINRDLVAFQSMLNTDIPYEVLQWNGKLESAQKALSNGIFTRNYTDLQIVPTIKTN